MGEYNIAITDTAKQDIRSIATYIRDVLQEPTIAESMVDTILDAIFTLEDMPDRIGFVRDERLANMHIRSLLIKNYTAFFRRYML